MSYLKVKKWKIYLKIRKLMVNMLKLETIYLIEEENESEDSNIDWFIKY